MLQLYLLQEFTCTYKLKIIDKTLKKITFKMSGKQKAGTSVRIAIWQKWPLCNKSPESSRESKALT